MASPRVPRGLAFVAVSSALVSASASLGGPGPAPDSAEWMLLAVVTAAAAVGLIWLAPLESAGRRRAWRFFGLGLVLFAIAGVWFRVVYSDREVVPVSNPTDMLFVAGYACVVVAVILLFRRPGDEAPRSAVLDGLLLALAATTAAEAAILHPMASSAGAVDQATRAAALLYPVLSLSLLGTVLARGGRDLLRSPRLQALAAGAGLAAVADLAYVRRVAEGDLSAGAWYHSLYLLAALAFAAAGWLRAPAPRQREVEGVRMVVLPGGVAAVAAWVLVWDHYQPRSDLAVILATLTLGAVALRAGSTVHYLRQLLDMRRLALTDDLTGLPNRRWFIRRLDDAVAREPAAGFTVLLLGIDRFKDLNDTLGHAVGDRVLRDGAARLASVLGPGDLVARIGGDEFAVLSPGGDDGAADRVVAAVRGAFAETFALADLDVPIDMSIGVVFWPGDGDTAEALLRRADVALADAKRSRVGFARYQPARDPYSRERLALAAEIRAAIGAGALTVVYQPILDVRSWTISGAEALVRWDHPTFGRMGPDEFLSIAQQTGSMRALTGFVLDTALQQCEQWRGQAVDLVVGVNLAPSSLLDARLPAAVDAALRRAGLPPSSLMLEIVEDGLLEDPTAALAILRSIRDLGVRLAIDDYGTGYASLGYLKDLPVQSLKIDRSFVAGLDDREPDSAVRNAAIVRSTIVLAHELGLTVVAEGVEDARTLLQLERKGVDAVQGFFVSEPLPGGDIPTISASWTPARKSRSAVP